MLDFVPELHTPEHFTKFPYELEFDEPLYVARDLFETLEPLGVNIRRVWRTDNEDEIMTMIEEHQNRRMRRSASQKPPPPVIDIKHSRYYLINVEMEYDGEVIVKSFYCPRLLQDQTCLLGDVNHYFIWQMVECEGYVTPGKTPDSTCAVVKTMTMPYTVRVNNYPLVIPNENTELPVRSLEIDISKQCVPLTTYFFNMWTPYQLVCYFGLADKIKFFNAREHPNRMSTDNTIVVIASEIGIEIQRRIFYEGPQYIRDFIGTMIRDLSRTEMRFEHLFDREAWCARLGSYFVQNTNVQTKRGLQMLRSLERLLDRRTQRLLVSVPWEWRQNTGQFTLWLFLNIDYWLAIDSTHMNSKRIRRQELLLYGLFRRISVIADQLLKKKKNRKTVISILNSLSPDEIVRFCSQVDTLRYRDCVNHSSPHLRQVTKKGKYAMGSDSRRIPTKHMYYLPSMVGVLGPTSTSNADPGMTSTICPSTQIDPYGRFVSRPDYEAQLPQEDIEAGE